MSSDNAEFYVPDEPVEILMAAYDAGSKGITAPPAHERTLAVPSSLSNVSASTVSTATTAAYAGASAKFAALTGTFKVTQRTT